MVERKRCHCNPITTRMYRHIHTLVYRHQISSDSHSSYLYQLVGVWITARIRGSKLFPGEFDSSTPTSTIEWDWIHKSHGLSIFISSFPRVYIGWPKLRLKFLFRYEKLRKESVGTNDDQAANGSWVVKLEKIFNSSFGKFRKFTVNITVALK